MPPLIDLTNKKFGRLTVLEIAGKTSRGIILWKCSCSCGNIKVVSGSKLTIGNTRSCGCYRKEFQAGRHALPDGEASFNDLYIAYRNRARNKNIQFSLTKDDMRKITKQKCFYCGREPFREYKSKISSYIYNGIDRMDNSMGYTIDNSVPCCKECNTAKSVLTVDEFVDLISRIYNNFVVFNSVSSMESINAKS